MFPEWHHAVPESAYIKVPETLKTFHMYSTSRHAPCSAGSRLRVARGILLSAGPLRRGLATFATSTGARETVGAKT